MIQSISAPSAVVKLVSVIVEADFDFDNPVTFWENPFMIQHVVLFAISDTNKNTSNSNYENYYFI